MTAPPTTTLRDAQVARFLIPIFFLSGLASLVYQVVWQRLLTLHYGVGSVSITLIVSVYMFGLGLGALLGGRLSERVRDGLRAYCWIELLIGLFGLASLPFLAGLARFTAGSSHGVSWLAMTGFLVIPTLLMGATLPLLVKSFNRVVHDFLLSVSLLYFVNTLGAAVGALLTAYVLISFWGLDAALYTAVVLNFCLAVAVYVLGRGWTPAAAAASDSRTVEAPPADGVAPLGRLVYPLVFVSGLLAIGYELVWFRLIGVLIKSSPYAFATSLSVYLFAIALGSYGVELLVSRRPGIRRIDLFFGIQFAVGLSVVALVGGFGQLVATGAADSLARPGFGEILHPASWALGEVLGVFLWPVFFQLVPALLIGAGFPLLASLALARPDEEGATVGRVYFTNTLGNMAGGVLTGFVLLEWLGTERTLLLFASVNLLLLLLAPRRRGGRAALRFGAVGLALAAAFLFMPDKGRLYRSLHPVPGTGFETYLEEGVDGVIVSFERGPQVVNYINGLAHGGRPEPMFITQAFEALSTAPSVEEVLVIGFGTGTFVEIALGSPEVRRVTLVELSRTLMANLARMETFREVLGDPRLDTVFDDGRRFLQRSNATWGLIMMDPLRSTTAYSNNLYSREFFELAASRLSTCGVLLLWTDEASVIPRTLASSFPHAVLYALPEGSGFLMGSRCPLERSSRRLAAVLARAPEEQRAYMTRRMRELRPALDREGILRRTEGKPLNRDHRPVTEYYLGLDRR